MARTTRPIPILLTALVAFFSALAAVAVADGQMAHAHGPAGQHHHAVVTPKQVALHDAMRKLWEDHVTWTRLAVISLTTGAPDTNATVGRLLKNQVDIGNAVKPFYGSAAGDQLTALLKEHILIAADLIAAAKSGNQAAVALNSLNPRFWKLDALKAELHMHLKLTTDEVVARLQGDWAADVVAYDGVHGHMLHLADLLSSGLAKQFPQRFR
jgi:hypothetical protein